MVIKVKKPTELEYIAAFINSVLFAASSGVIIISTMGEVTTTVYNLSNLIGLGMGVLVLHLLKDRQHRQVVMRYFYVVILADMAFFSTIAYLSLDDLMLRYVLLAVTYPIIDDLLKTLIDDIHHRHFTGDDLTDFKTTIRAKSTTGTVLGFIAATLVVQLDVPITLEIGLTLQVIAVAFSSYVSIAWRRYDEKGSSVYIDTPQPLNE